MKRILSIGTILLFVGMSISSSTGFNVKKESSIPISEKTLYVGGSGPENYTKIQDAIDNASDGDTVFVYNGTYYENVIIKKSIDLIGENKETTIIWNILNTSGGTILIFSDNVNICGFGITNSSCSEPGIEMLSTSNNSVYDCIVYDNYDGIWIQNSKNISLSTINSTDGIFFHNVANSYINHCIIQNTSGIYIEESDRNTIENCTISNSSYGIWLDFSSHNHLIKDCIIFNNRDYGVRIDRSNRAIVENCRISNTRLGFLLWQTSDNTITDNILYNNGVYITWSENNNFSGNTINERPLIYLEGAYNQKIYDAGQVILINCDNITIENQTLSNTTVGLTLWNTNNCQIKSNTLTNNSWGGIRLDFSLYNIINNNTIASNGLRGIQLGRQSFNNIIYDNIINDNDDGIELGLSNNCQIYKNEVSDNKDWGILISSGNNNNISSNNIFNNTLYGIALYSNSNNIVSGNTLQNNLKGGALISSSNNNRIDNNIIVECINKTNGEGFLLMFANNNTILKNQILRNQIGILLVNSSKNHFLYNSIKNNLGAGIKSWGGGSYNTIEKNLIRFNYHGIYLETSGNKIAKNNIIDNKIQAFFRGCKNTWDDNYWNRMRFLPKPIFGTLGLLGLISLIPWINFDWHPASEPYDIEV